MARPKKSDELADLLRCQISSGKLQAGDQLEPIVKLAKCHHTTVATVSKALESLEQAGYVERFPGKGVYVRAKTGCRLAMVVDDFIFQDTASGSFMPLFTQELDHKCRELNWTYELFINVRDSASAHDFLVKLGQSAFDAVLVSSLWVAQNSASIFRDKPVFVAGIYPYKELRFSLSFDSRRMVHDAVLDLHRLGCSQIALIQSEKDLSWSMTPEAFLDGYKEAIKEIGCLRDSRLIQRVPLSQKGGHDAFRELLASKASRPFGVVCTDSMLTLGAIQAVLSHGLRLPEDILIATHTNRGCSSAHFAVPVIRYESPIDEYVERLTESIHEHLAGLNTEDGVVFIPPLKQELTVCEPAGLGG